MTFPARRHARPSRPGLHLAAAAAWFTLALPLCAQAPSIRYGTVTAEPIRLTHTGELVAEAAAPSRAAFAVVLITPNGTLPPSELQEARAAAQKMADMLVSAGRVKFGTEVTLTHEILVATPSEAAGHRQRLTDAGFTFINRSSVRINSRTMSTENTGLREYLAPEPTTNQTQIRVGVENYGLKEYADDDVLGEAELMLTITAHPEISARGDIKLHLKVAAEDARVTRRAPGADDSAVPAALARFQKESIEQTEKLLFPANWRKWTLTRRDLEAIARGTVPLRKAVPLEVHGQATRLRLTIPAELVFPHAGAAGATWEAPE